MDKLMDKSWELGTADLIQQTAAFLWLHRGEEYKKLYTDVTGARVAYELYNRLTTNKDIDLYKTQCLSGIVDYIKTHPKASEAELTAELTKHVKLFKQRVEAI